MVSGKATASVDGKTVAETTEWEEVEGNVYFPPGALDRDLFSGPTSLHTTCGWKGEASYYTITVGDRPTKKKNRQDARERGLVLPDAQAQGRAHQGLCGFLQDQGRRHKDCRVNRTGHKGGGGGGGGGGGWAGGGAEKETSTEYVGLSRRDDERVAPRHTQNMCCLGKVA
ncbi:hypothetical protein RB594_009946 [Gaeumannomyces avenae]